MTTITHKNRNFKVIELKNISETPALAAAQPNLEFFFIAEGVKGALISGYITKKGGVVVF